MGLIKLPVTFGRSKYSPPFSFLLFLPVCIRVTAASTILLRSTFMRKNSLSKAKEKQEGNESETGKGGRKRDRYEFQRLSDHNDLYVRGTIDCIPLYHVLRCFASSRYHLLTCAYLVFVRTNVSLQKSPYPATSTKEEIIPLCNVVLNFKSNFISNASGAEIFDTHPQRPCHSISLR